MRYAVIRYSGSSDKMVFSIWHETAEIARAEAMRLCQKERCPFIVMKEVGMACIEEMPVTYKHYSE